MTVTQSLIVIAVGLTIIIDLILLEVKGVEATISRALYTWSKQYPIIAFAFGVVAGHLFWSNGG